MSLPANPTLAVFDQSIKSDRAFQLNCSKVRQDIFPSTIQHLYALVDHRGGIFMKWQPAPSVGGILTLRDRVSDSVRRRKFRNGAPWCVEVEIEFRLSPPERLHVLVIEHQY